MSNGERAGADYSLTLQADAAAAMRDRKFTKAEHYLRKLLSVAVQGSGQAESGQVWPRG